MAYQIVDKALFFPHKCAVTGWGDGPFVDTGGEIVGLDPHVYIDAQVAQDIAKQVFGMATREDHEAVVERLEQARRRCMELEEELDDHRRFRESVEYTFAEVGAKVKRKPGRPPNKKIEVA